VVVLGSVMIGGKLAGVPGAIFGVPVAAVFASFFFYYLGHMRVDSQSVTMRAARRVEEREGRPVRVPRLPQAGQDQEVEPGLAAEPQPMARKGSRPVTPDAVAPDAAPTPDAAATQPDA
jgi:hypothetical protein